MATAKGQKIADYAKSKIGCAYIWGGYGEKLCTPSFRKERAEAYPSQKENIYRYCQVLTGQKTICNGCKYNGKQAYDCAQLTRYACKAAGTELVSGANSQWKSGAWETKGTMDTLPDEPGVILYHANADGTMTHTGVAIGNGNAVEARAAAYGVVETSIKNRSWTNWAALPGVLSDDGWKEQSEHEKPKETNSDAKNDETGIVVTTMSTLRKGDRGVQVKVLQFLLNESGFNAGDVDGIFGSQTERAVRDYQRYKRIDRDGICGRNTWGKLLDM
ncbi:MAG: peptidoglycan-binding domain-containing protein [Clostridia bacterium]|nr:peptidoglycan-binding domain-containing protein [Clostridia bacterium]